MKRGVRARFRAGAVVALAATLFVAAFGLRARAGDPPRLVFESARLDIQAFDKLLAFTDVGNMRLYLSNAGTLGTAFNSRDQPSMEWPARSGIDHLVRGALWIGAVSHSETLVTTGGRDAYYLDPIFQHSEYTPVSGRPQEFSRLRASPFFRAGTVADENYHTIFVDSLPVVKQGTEPAHRPLGIRVQQETYSWGFDPLDDFVILEYNIVNHGDAALRRVWVGIYTEFATNNRQAWSNWPPGGGWFDFQRATYDTTLHMLKNRHNRGGSPAGVAKPWAALKLVGTGGAGAYGRGPDSLSTKRVTLTAWNWDPAQFLALGDDSLYARMSTGLQTDFRQFDPNNTELNPTSIFAVGPFQQLDPGDTTQVVFAMIAGRDSVDLYKNAAWAQKAYDDKYAVPSPPGSPLLHVYPRHNEVILRWSSHPESEVDPASRTVDFQGYRVYLSKSPLAADYDLVRQFDIRDGHGFDTGLEAVKLSQPYIENGQPLDYELRLSGIPDGFKRYAAVTAYDMQPGQPPSLESGVLQNSVYFVAGPDAEQARGKKVTVFPNPYRGESAFDGRDALGAINPRRRVLWFVNLPPRARIKIFTLAGDEVRSYDYDRATYRGTEAAGISPDAADLFQGRYLVTGGSMAAFDLLSNDRQEIATGLYLFSVEDRSNGETQQGKFMVLK